MRHFISGDMIWFDTETTGLFPYLGDAPFAFSFANEEGDTRYFEFRVNPYTRKVVPDKLALKHIRRLLEDPKVKKGGHNFRYDTLMMEIAWGIQIAGPGGPVRYGGAFEDTEFMARVCRTDEFSYQLKPLTKKYAKIPDKDEKGLLDLVKRLRRKAKPEGWKLAFDLTEKPDGTIKKKGAIHADYWLPRTSRLMGRKWCSEEESHRCEEYATWDVLRCLALNMLYQDVMDEKEVRHTYVAEKKLWPTIYNMSFRGVAVYPDKVAEEMENCRRKILGLEKEFRKELWKDFNPDSDAHVRRAVYEHFKLPVNARHMTKGGKSGLNKKPGVNVKALDEHRYHPFVAKLFEHRGQSKAFSYFRSYDKYMTKDHLGSAMMILHSDFRQMGAETGRLSCATPNLQQATDVGSTRSASAVEVRKVFGPRRKRLMSAVEAGMPKYVWFHNDYRGMEVRIFAEVAQEPNMLKAIADGREIHDEVTNRGWGGENNPQGIEECVRVIGLRGGDAIRQPQVQAMWKEWGISRPERYSEKEKRKIAAEWLASFDWDIVEAQGSVGFKTTKNKAKMVTFLKIYGGRAKAAMNLLRCTMKEAKEFLANYDRAFPRIEQYAKELEKMSRKLGYVETLWGRKIDVHPDYAYRCVNYKIQGSAADLLKSAMIKCDRMLKKKDYDAHIVMSVHDELVLEVAEYDLTRQFVYDVQRVMEDTDGKITIPMPTDPSVALRTWNVKEKLEIPERKVAA